MSKFNGTLHFQNFKDIKFIHFPLNFNKTNVFNIQKRRNYPFFTKFQTQNYSKYQFYNKSTPKLLSNPTPKMQNRPKTQNLHQQLNRAQHTNKSTCKSIQIEQNSTSRSKFPTNTLLYQLVEILGPKYGGLRADIHPEIMKRREKTRYKQLGLE
jgi:hypothetical protein